MKKTKVTVWMDTIKNDPAVKVVKGHGPHTTYYVKGGK